MSEEPSLFDKIRYMIAATMDLPSIIMGGPSRDSLRKTDDLMLSLTPLLEDAMSVRRRSVGWIKWNPVTRRKGKTGGYYSGMSTKVYRSENIARNYCVGDEIPAEVFIMEPTDGTGHDNAA